MDDPLNTDEVKIWKMFLRAHAALMRTLGAEIQNAHGISLRWLDVLVQLSLADRKRMTHSRLNERLLVDGAGGGVTRLIDRMAKEGLVVRRASRKDRRTSYIVLTKIGEDALAAATPDTLADVQEHFLRHLRKEEMSTIRGFLSRILGEDAKTGEA
ncbi:MAG: MarR family transcriptional regulator [Chloroflexi bacterium]|nr:MarR family transcriptional regulator [Chloroflexota bacterium]